MAQTIFGGCHDFCVVGCGSKFTQYLISIFEALEKRQRFVLQPLLKFWGKSLALGDFPPRLFRVCGASQSGPNTTVVLLDDGFCLAAAAVIASNLGDIDPQIDGKTSIQIFLQSRNVRRAGWVEPAHLKSDDVRQAVRRGPVVGAAVFAESGLPKQRVEMGLQCIE